MCCNSSVGKKSIYNAGDPGSIPGLGRSAGERIGYPLQYSWASLVVQDSKESTCNVGVLGLIPGEGNGYPFQYSGLDNSMDRGAWQAIQFMGSHAKRQETDMTGQLSLFCANSMFTFLRNYSFGIIPYKLSFLCRQHPGDKVVK